MPSIPSLLLLLLLSIKLALGELSFALEPGPEHVSGRGMCIEYRIPANSLVTGSFFAEPIIPPQPGAPTPRIIATVNIDAFKIISNLILFCSPSFFIVVDL